MHGDRSIECSPTSAFTSLRATCETEVAGKMIDQVATMKAVDGGMNLMGGCRYVYSHSSVIKRFLLPEGQTTRSVTIMEAMHTLVLIEDTFFLEYVRVIFMKDCKLFCFDRFRQVT